MLTIHFHEPTGDAIESITKKLIELTKLAEKSGFTVTRVKLEHESLPTFSRFDEVHIKLDIPAPLYKKDLIEIVKNLEKLLESQRRIRVLGLDDSHFAKVKGSVVNVADVVCIDTRFEGMLWSELSQNGLDATDRICQMVVGSKFAPLLHLVLTDGISFGGSNIIELPILAEQFQVPVVAVMRKYPNLQHFRYVLNQLSEPEERWRRVQAAGAIHQIDGWVFQCIGEDPAIIAKTLTRLTDHGKVPEALRLAHLIGSAIKFGESTKRA